MIASAKEVLKFSVEALKFTQKDPSYGYGIMNVLEVQNDLHSKAVHALSLHQHDSNSNVNELLLTATEPEAKRRLTETIELLEKKSAHIEEEIKTEERTARENVLKKKILARRALKRKRRLEKQLKQLDGTISTLEFQVEALKNANINVAVINSTKHASGH